MRCLTVMQPWAFAIFHGKTVENRTQLWKYRGPLAIHAGQRISDRGWDNELVRNAYAAAHCPVMHLGAIIGTVELVDCHPDAGCCKPWGESAYVEHGGRERRRITHLVLESPRLLAEPIPCSGALGLWTPPADVLARLEYAIGRCDHNGGYGIGAGHECRCIRRAGHPMDSDRPHGCGCGALWSEENL